MPFFIHIAPILCVSISTYMGTDATPTTSVTGCVVDVFRDDVDDKFVYLTLKRNGEAMFISTFTNDSTDELRKLQDLIGCDVSVACFPLMLSLRSHRRVLRELLVHNAEDRIVVLTPSAHNAYDVPDLSQKPPDYHNIDACGPRKTHGDVIARWHGDKILLHTGDDAIRVTFRDKHLPALGEVIEVVGHATTDLYRFNLEQAQWRSLQATHSPNGQAERQSLSAIFSKNGVPIIHSGRHGQTLCISGLLKSILSDESGRNRFIIQEGDYQMIVDCSALPQAIDGLQEGSEIEVTGVGVMESESYHPGMSFPKVSGLFLVPRTFDDIRVLRQPPWWTPFRMLMVILGLLAVLAAILIWNASLRVLVARKSRALLREQALKLSETLKINERTRLAAELHDFHSQNLTAVAYQISSAQNSCESDPHETKHLLATAVRMLKSCRTDLRRCLWDLRSDALDEPDFAKAIHETVTPVAGTATVSVRFAGHRAQISDTTAHAILSILRELTANAVVHGKATTVRIAGEQRSQMIRFSVQDNGCGFNTAVRLGQNEGHFGLDGIQERMNRLGGSFTLESAPGKGTYIRLSISHQKLP